MSRDTGRPTREERRRAELQERPARRRDRRPEPALVRDYVNTGPLRLVYRDFAFLGAESVDAAVGARCPAEQNRFWQYHDYLFADQQGENRGAFSAWCVAYAVSVLAGWLVALLILRRPAREGI